MINSRPQGTLTIDLADLPLIVHALSIARATAMMITGQRHKDRVDVLHKQLVAMTPPVALKFDEYKFCDIIFVLIVVKTMKSRIEQHRTGRKTISQR